MMMKFDFLFTRAFLASMISAAGFVYLAQLIYDNSMVHFDQTVITAIQGRESPILTKVMVFFTTIGTGLPMVVIMISIMYVLYFILGHRQELFFFTGVVIGSALLNVCLKQVFKRARPIFHRIIEANGYSFPSGHSMAAFSLYSIALFLLWKHTHTKGIRIVLILTGSFFILMIGISRIYLGVHYPSDVVGGYLASGCWITAAVWFYQRRLSKY